MKSEKAGERVFADVDEALAERIVSRSKQNGGEAEVAGLTRNPPTSEGIPRQARNDGRQNDDRRNDGGSNGVIAGLTRNPPVVIAALLVILLILLLGRGRKK